MNTSKNDSAWTQSLLALEKALEEFQFKFVGTYSRYPGIAVELVSNDRRLFLACEGNVLYIDLIIAGEQQGYWRISLNQALWFQGVKSLLNAGGCENELSAFIREIPRLNELLSGNLTNADSRFCFPMSKSDYEDYLKWQRGTKS